jgi:4a-hydroxytetrahydrobiopterin dehydratase
MRDLAQEKCVPCENDIPAMKDNEIEKHLTEIPKWEVIRVEGIPHLKRTFEFKNFAKALEFTNTIGELAEQQGHHPVITLTWGRATIEWWTHNIEGLHKNDFIMAAKTSEVYAEFNA